MQVIALGVALVFGLFMPQAKAQPQVYEPGVHYQELSMPLPDADPDRVDVMELFWYGCPLCYDLLPTFQIWESSYRSSDMNFTRAPVIWNQVMETHARLYLTADELNLVPLAPKSSWEVTPTLHNAVFDAIHGDNKPLSSAPEIQPLFAAAGVTQDAFEAAWNSEAVERRLSEIKILSAPPELTSLPALLVDGRYVITFNESVKTSEDLYKVLNFLIVQIRNTK
ncbi:MAG: thiol:disulfide interchange protein DsbA/DsbL [Pseudomonadales bacterium]|jgi:thiol:disulfide interchange protein DsbA|nr:thiol:disulfide interchange protein DsbA/DsbL [Pseudomonadales bacterium]